MVQTQAARPEAAVPVQQPTRMAPPPHADVAIPPCQAVCLGITAPVPDNGMEKPFVSPYHFPWSLGTGAGSPGVCLWEPPAATHTEGAGSMLGERFGRPPSLPAATSLCLRLPCRSLGLW